MFNITESAYIALQDALRREQDDSEKLYVRLTMGIGRGGPKLQLSLEEQPLEADHAFEFDEVSIVIHKDDMVYFDHTKLDYVKDVFQSGRFQLLRV